MALLTQSRYIPPFAVLRVKIKMMYGQNVARKPVVWMAASNAFPSGSIFCAACNIRPIRRIIRF